MKHSSHRVLNILVAIGKGKEELCCGIGLDAAVGFVERGWHGPTTFIGVIVGEDKNI